MKKLIYKSLTWMLLVSILVTACKEDDPTLGPPPTEADAVFSFEPTEVSPNIIELTNTAPGIKKWDFGDGNIAEGNVVTATYPFQGDYVVTLTVYAQGGSVSSEQTIHIAESDESLLKPVYTLLSGGKAMPEGKTWIIAADVAGHMGIGPADAAAPNWWAAGPNEKSETGLYDDKFTFKLSGFQFVQTTNGDVYVNGAQASKFPDAYPNKGDYTAPYTAPTNLRWSISTDAKGRDFISISSNGFMGYYAGSSRYEILSITESELSIKFIDGVVPGNAWFHKLIVEGFEPPPPPTSTLPLTFEGAKHPFEGFGGSGYDRVDNPSSSGINTSSKVGKLAKGPETWAGIVTNLTSKVDFSTNTLFKLKLYSPKTGIAKLKLEFSGDPNNVNKEVDANITKVNEWEELSFDFSGAPTDTYDRLVLFFDFGSTDQNEFFFDDVQQTFVAAALTEADLTGGSSKSWVLKPAAGSFGVGPNKGDMSWWPGANDISGDRPCLFNDEFIFKTGGVYEYDANDDIWGEVYMGLTDGCTAESNMPAGNAAWKSGTHSFTFTPESGGTPASIAVSGTGAFIALPKAYNGGEYAAGPPTAGSVTYEVLSYVKNGASESITIAVNIPGGYWTFVLIPK
ncbi:MAG TPA: PKD domain-containing protein [Ohtaekwangia sp.]